MMTKNLLIDVYLNANTKIVGLFSKSNVMVAGNIVVLILSCALLKII